MAFELFIFSQMVIFGIYLSVRHLLNRFYRDVLMSVLHPARVITFAWRPAL